MVEVYRVATRPRPAARGDRGGRRARADAAVRTTTARRPIGWPSASRRGAPRRTASSRSAAAATCCGRRRRFRGRDGRPAGVVVASDYLTGEMAERSRRMTEAFEAVQQAEGAQEPDVRRLHLVLPDGDADDPRGAPPGSGCTSRSGSRGRSRCSRPPRATSAPGASTTGSSRRRRTSSARSSRRSTRWPASCRTAGSDLERSTRDLQRQHQEVEARRRYIETVLERITTGVVSLDAGGRVTTINSAAARLLGLGDGGGRAAGRRPVRPPGPRAARSR